MAALSPAAGQADPATALWHRLADQRLRLRDTVTVHEHRYRGRLWFLLQEALGGRQFRLSRAVYGVLAHLDGQRTLDEAWALSSESEAGQVQVPTEMVTTLTQLHAAGILTAGRSENIGPMIEQQRLARRRQRLGRWMRLLSPRLPLLDPEALLGRLLPHLSWMLHPFALMAGLLVVLAAGLQSLIHWDALTLYGAQRMDDPQSWLLLVCLYPLVKGLHELGHGLAARSTGAAVNEMGITLLVFLPVPYVDASAASLLEDKRQRMSVSAAGILVELLLAALAMLAWLYLPDGLLREVAFSVMVIGGVSTLLFNGNPLLRFDGYYVLSDALEVPNLATRAGRYYGYLGRRHLLGLNDEPVPDLMQGERPWLLAYGAASTLYRLFISIGIALFLIAAVPTLGVLMAAWLLTVQFALPLARQLRFMLFSPALRGRRLRAWLQVGGGGALLLGLLALAPAPSSTLVEGVVRLPERAIVRAGVDGFVERQLVAHGHEVAPGDLLFVLRNPQLENEIAVHAARVLELEARLGAVALEDRLTREIHADRLHEARRTLDELRQRARGLQVQSPSSGLLQVPAAVDLPGRLIEQGQLIAYVAGDGELQVQVAAAQEDAARIRAGVKRVDVRMADAGADLVEGRLLHEVPAGSDLLPSAVLGSRGGGDIRVDARDEQGTKALHRVFLFDVAIPFNASTRYIGARAYVRFEHAARPLLARWYESGRRLLMERIGE